MSSYDRDDIESIARAIRYDLTAAQAKLTELMTAISAAQIRPIRRVACPECGASLQGPYALAEHLWNVHDGPEPEHWMQIEARVET